MLCLDFSMPSKRLIIVDKIGFALIHLFLFLQIFWIENKNANDLRLFHTKAGISLRDEKTQDKGDKYQIKDPKTIFDVAFPAIFILEERKV
jgi:hypothetical protein